MTLFSSKYFSVAILSGLLCVVSVLSETALAATEDDKLTASDATAGDFFGRSVAISGTIAVIGAWGDNFDSGSAYVFDCSSLPCTEVDKLTASDAASSKRFGVSVAISGATVVIGADGDDNVGSRSGSAYVFDCSSLPCTEVDKLTASDAAELDGFGNSVSISGTTVVVGRSNFVGSRSGSAYVFDCSSLPCTEVGKLTASNAADNDSFGSSVAISGTIALVGAFRGDDAGIDSGSAYVFDCSSLPCAQVGKLTASDAAVGDQFGLRVAISGTTAVIGAKEDDDGGQNSGSAYVFDCSSLPCTQVGKLTASDAFPGARFGGSVAISGATAVIGYIGDDPGPTPATGAAYVFTLIEPFTPDLTAQSNASPYQCYEVSFPDECSATPTDCTYVDARYVDCTFGEFTPATVDIKWNKKGTNFTGKIKTPERNESFSFAYPVGGKGQARAKGTFYSDIGGMFNIRDGDTAQSCSCP